MSGAFRPVSRFLATLLIGAALLLGAAPLYAFDTTAQQALQPLSPDPVVIETGQGTRLKVQVELALTPEARALGLMHRTELAAGQGMLFIFEGPERLSFWMRNTLIPLDMIFVRQNGRIANIIENAEPQTDTPRPSKGRAVAVLEIAGGEAARLGLRAGDMVRHPLLGNMVQE